MDHTEDSQAPGADQVTAFWEGHYGQRDQIWSGNPNAVLMHEVEHLPPGTALDLGCGEGGDAIWLAGRGWQVTGVDVSDLALTRAAAAADQAGVSAHIDWRRLDLAVSFPQGTFDLVSAQFLHSPIDFPRGHVLRSAACAVAPGGTLLVVGHADVPPWTAAKHHDHDHGELPTPEQVVADLDLVAADWEDQLLARPERRATGPDGQTATLTDSVVRLRRRR